MTSSPKRILVLWWNNVPASQTRLTIFHHLHALDESPVPHNIIYYNAFIPLPEWFREISFDAIIFHYSFVAMRFAPDYWSKWKPKMDWIAEWDCVKIAIPQDEYDKSQVLDEWLDEWGISVIFSCFEGKNAQIIYPIMSQKAMFYYCFTGYIHQKTGKELSKKIKPLSDRDYDIIYRARNLPFQFGHHGQLKHQIADIVSKSATRLGLSHNISTKAKDTIYGKHWVDFMASGKATIGTESGSSALDIKGKIKQKITDLLAENPEMTFEEISKQMPDGWDSYEFFAISPRHFEAVMTKTCQILMEGNYSGVLKANQHYIPLKRDFSNLDEALEKLKDDDYVQAIIDCAYEDIYLSGKYTYEAMAHVIETAIDVEHQKLGVQSQPIPKSLWQKAKKQALYANLRVRLFTIVVYLYPYLKMPLVVLRKVIRNTGYEGPIKPRDVINSIRNRD